MWDVKECIKNLHKPVFILYNALLLFNEGKMVRTTRVFGLIAVACSSICCACYSSSDSKSSEGNPGLYKIEQPVSDPSVVVILPKVYDIAGRIVIGAITCSSLDVPDNLKSLLPCPQFTDEEAFFNYVVKLFCSSKRAARFGSGLYLQIYFAASVILAEFFSCKSFALPSVGAEILSVAPMRFGSSYPIAFSLQDHELNGLFVKEMNTLLDCFGDLMVGGNPQMYNQPYKSIMEQIAQDGCPSERLVTWAATFVHKYPGLFASGSH
jgi:hypothetical protein